MKINVQQSETQSETQQHQQQTRCPEWGKTSLEWKKSLPCRGTLNISCLDREKTSLERKKILPCHGTSNISCLERKQILRCHGTIDLHQIFNQKITAPMKGTPRLPPLIFNNNAKAYLEQILEGHIGDGSYANLRQTWSMWRQFAQTNRLRMTTDSAMKFLAAKAVTGKPDGSKHRFTYLNGLLKNCRSLINKMNLFSQNKEEELLLMSTMSTGLRKQPEALRETEDHAIPMCKLSLMSNLHREDPVLQRGLWLTRKTSSRWDEVFELLLENLKRISHTAIHVNFAIVKHKQRHRADQHVICVDSPAMIQWFWDGLKYFVRTDQPWKPWPTKVLDTNLTKWKMNECDLLEADPSTIHIHYTAHSIKHGAANHLMRAVTAGKISPQLFSIMLKHKTKDRQDMIPTEDVRYVSVKSLIAFSTGTHKATRLL